jgi:hypothetical protein
MVSVNSLKPWQRRVSELVYRVTGERYYLAFIGTVPRVRHRVRRG